MVFRVTFTIVAYYNLDINQIDVKTTFFYNLIDLLVYMHIYTRSEDASIKKIICKLLNALYDLKQIPRLGTKNYPNSYSKSSNSSTLM